MIFVTFFIFWQTSVIDELDLAAARAMGGGDPAALGEAQRLLRPTEDSEARPSELAAYFGWDDRWKGKTVRTRKKYLHIAGMWEKS